MGPGWGCRDHAVVLAARLTSGGTDAQVVHGANVFIQGPTTDGQDPVGLGNDLAHGGEHTWVHVSPFGTVDVSLRLSERVQSWRPLPVSGLTGTDWQVPGLMTRVAVVSSAPDYQQAVAVATNAVDTPTAIYWPKRTAEGI